MNKINTDDLLTAINGSIKRIKEIYDSGICSGNMTHTINLIETLNNLDYCQKYLNIVQAKQEQSDSNLTLDR